MRGAKAGVSPPRQSYTYMYIYFFLGKNIYVTYWGDGNTPHGETAYLPNRNWKILCGSMILRRREGYVHGSSFAIIFLLINN